MESRRDNHSSQFVEEWIAQEILRHPEQLVMTFMNAPNVGVGISTGSFDSGASMRLWLA